MGGPNSWVGSTVFQNVTQRTNLADIVVGVSFQLYIDPAGEEGAEALATGPLELDLYASM